MPRLIVLSSALGLYFEMLIIRWHATSSHVFAVFKNVSLLSCFLGLGLGYALARSVRTISLAKFPVLLAAQFFLFAVLSSTIGGRRVNPVAEQLVMGQTADTWNYLFLLEGDAFLAAVFVINAVMFLPLGHLNGRLMARLPAVRGYGLNLLGSLAGIAVFFLLSLGWTTPAVWIGLAVLGLVPFLVGTRGLGTTGVVSVGLAPSTSGVLGLPLIEGMREHYPEIRIHLVEGMSGHLGQMLNGRELDLAVLFDNGHARRCRHKILHGQPHHL